MLKTVNNYPYGLIEGFFGIPWPENIRLNYPSWLKRNGYDFYIYAPKNDSNLRKNWRTPFSENYINFLRRFTQSCTKANIKSGIGFTPLGATLNTIEELPLFKTQLTTILDQTKPQILALLFDDLKIDSEHIATNQNILLREAKDICSKYNIKLMTCPTFYTEDPILEKVFGPKPKSYYEDFLKGLCDNFFYDFNNPNSIEVFWTGPKVISENYPLNNLCLAQKLFGRKPFIWDNYPVNDGKKASNLLNLAPFTPTREHFLTHTQGVAINPMKQPYLSMLPLSTIKDAIYQTSTSNNNFESELLKKDASQTAQDTIMLAKYILNIKTSNLPIEQLYPGYSNQFLRFLVQVVAPHLTTSLDEWSYDTKQTLLNELNRFQDCPVAIELKNFINGEYAFDPACLTG